MPQWWKLFGQRDTEEVGIKGEKNEKIGLSEVSIRDQNWNH